MGLFGDIMDEVSKEMEKKDKEEGKDKINITDSQAKDIAQDAITEPNCIAGNPSLVKEINTHTYYVPILSNGKEVGMVFVAAHSGEVTGQTKN